MNALSLLIDIKLDTWYRGNRIIEPIKITSDTIKMSNNDVIEYKNNIFYINKTRIAQLEDLTPEEAYELYITNLKNRNYKLL